MGEKQNMKVIFLDVDGVLNSEKDLLNADGDSEIFDRPLELLKRLVDSTKANIVISSSWRIGCAKSGKKSYYEEELFKILEKRLSDYQMKIFDITPVINKPNIKRGDEIREWLRNTKYRIESFVILDDENDMCEFTSTNLVQTSMETGLTEDHILIAENILNPDTKPVQEKIISHLLKIWEKRPEWRFGQLIVNVLGVDPYYMKDENILNKIIECERKLQ